MIRFTCPSCGRRVAAPDNAAGKRGRCPCGAAARVPDPDSYPVLGVWDPPGAWARVNVVLGYRRTGGGWVPFAVRQKIRPYKYRRGEQRLDRQQAEDFDPERAAGWEIREIYRTLTAERWGFVEAKARQVWANFLALGYEKYYNPQTGKYLMGRLRYHPGKGWQMVKRDLYRTVRADVFRQARLHGVFAEAEARVDPEYVVQQLIEAYGTLTGGLGYGPDPDIPALPPGVVPYGQARGVPERYIRSGVVAEESPETDEDDPLYGMEHLTGRGTPGLRELASHQGLGRGESPEKDRWKQSYMVRIVRARTLDELWAVQEEIDERFSRTQEVASRMMTAKQDLGKTSRKYRRTASGWDMLKETDAGKVILEAWESRKNAIAGRLVP